MKDHYKILGINPDSTQDEIKKAYRLLALRHHPDRNGGSRDSEELFKQISESYLILGDVSSRKVYDDWHYEHHNPAPESPEPGKVTPTTFLMIFRNIRERVYNAGGAVSGPLLFEIINSVLTTENLNYLVQVEDIRTNGLIIDELIVSSVFLDDSSKLVLYRKLVRLAHGNAVLREKVAALSTIQYEPRTEPLADEFSWDYIYVFIGMLILIVLLAVMAG